MHVLLAYAAVMLLRAGPWQGFQTTTVDGTANVLKAARAAGVTRFVHIGTEAVLIAHKQVL